TQLGDIAQMIQAVETKPSPLQNTVKSLTKTLMLVSAALVIFTFVAGIIKAGEFTFASFAAILSTSIALAVASIPDALPAVLSIVLTIGARKMAQNQGRSEEHTSELQSRFDLVCRLLLEKKNQIISISRIK